MNALSPVQLCSLAIALGSTAVALALLSDPPIVYLLLAVTTAALLLLAFIRLPLLAEHHQRRVIDGMPGLVWIASSNGETRYVNAYVLSYTGRRFDELKDFEWSQVIHPDDVEPMLQTWMHAVRTGAAYEFECRVRRCDGTYRWFKNSAQPTRDRAGRIVRWFGLAIDIDEAKRTEAALRTSERDLTEVLESIPGMIAGANSTGEQDYANARLLHYVGMGRVESAGLGWTEIVHPDDRDTVRNQWIHSAKTGEPYDVTHRMRRFDGEYRWFHARAEPRLDEQGRIVRWYGLIVDVHDRRRMEEALRVSEQQLRLLIDNIPGMVTVTNRDGDIEYANQRVLDFFGVDFPQLRTNRAVSEPACGTGTHSNDALYHMRRFDGEYRWLQRRTQAVSDDEGAIIRSYSLLVDVDDRRKAEEALRKSEHELRLITEAIPVFVWRATRDGVIEYGNKRAVDYTGQTLRDFGGAGWVDLVHPDDAEAVARKWRHSVTAGVPFELNYRIRGGHGSFRWFQVRAEALRDREGRIIHWYGACIDIDDSKRVEEALRSTQARLARASQVATLAELSASIAHEINQPLAAAVVSGHACQRWLRVDPPNLERAQLNVERMIRDSVSAAEVVSRIRALFKQADLKRNPVDLNDVIGEACRVITDEVSGRNVTIDTDLDEALPATWVDRVQIQQILVNLARNGVDAMDAVVDRPKRLLIRSRRDGTDRVLVEVCDHGTGVENPERIFEPFFTTKTKGMGMGLAVCRSIIEAHDGRLWAAKNESEGATFSFTLPLVPNGGV